MPLIRLPALITGASSDADPAIAITFAAEGAHAAATGRSQQRGSGLIAEIREAEVRPTSSPRASTAAGGAGGCHCAGRHHARDVQHDLPLEAAAGLAAGGREAGYRRDYQIRSED
jgi:NAD(P)-dependent dehydrogenase (short-subunit alcohol dehydrogenase family)